MKQTKFRAWDNLHKKMAEVETLRFDSSETAIEQAFLHYYNTPLNNDNWLPRGCIDLMQFTGLLDKNGKGIYEGDIVDFSEGYDGMEGKYIISWKYGGFWLDYLDGKEPEWEWNPFSLEGSNFEVIGNIYENPDLLNN